LRPVRPAPGVAALPRPVLHAAALPHAGPVPHGPPPALPGLAVRLLGHPDHDRRAPGVRAAHHRLHLRGHPVRRKRPGRRAARIRRLPPPRADDPAAPFRSWSHRIAAGEGMTVLHASVLDTIGRTPVVRLDRLAPAGAGLFAKLEAANPGGSVKD